VTSTFTEHFAPGDSGSTDLDYALFTPLTELNTATGTVQDAVAQSLTSSDNRVWTVTLKKGWTFSNGQPVTAQSFADSWNATVDAKNGFTNGYLFSDFAGYSATATSLSGVQVINDYTLKITLVKPLSTLPDLLAQSTFEPIPASALGNLPAFDHKPVGDGPYQLTGPAVTAATTQFTLTRVPGYAGANKGNAATVTVKVYQTETAAYRDFEAGALDVLGVTGSDLTSAASKYPSQLVKVDDPAVVYLGFPLWDHRFSNVKVREAFSLAIDRPAIVTSLLGGFGQAATGLAGSNIPGGGEANCAYCSYDTSRARALLSQAGGWKGSLTLWTDTDPSDSTVLTAIANELSSGLGISASTKTQPLAQLYPSLYAHKADGPMLLYMAASYPNLYSLADELFSVGSGTNVTGFSDATFTRLFSQAAQAPTAQATGLAQQAVNQAMTLVPLTPLYIPQGGIVHSARTGDITATFLGGASVPSVTVS
jgi:peptide/nickel transport system substrate-binding protein/oligopeptide transport system substrate-binding protein